MNKESTSSDSKSKTSFNVFIEWIKKNWKPVFLIPILIGVLIVTAIFVQLRKIATQGIVSSELSITHTPSVLQQVNELGELIGAEYYGEVVHSLVERYEEADLWAIQECYEGVKIAYERMYGFYERDEAGQLLPTSQRVARSVDRFLNAPLGYEEQWFQLLKDVEPQLNVLLEQIRTQSWRTFYRAHADQIEERRVAIRTELNKGVELVYMGRGLVKAGFDLQKVDSSQIRRSGDTLYVEGLDPAILHADINPWLIEPSPNTPAGIKGFEVLRETANPSPEQAKAVKAGCKQDLIQEALETELFEKAESSAEQTLFNFFNLIAVGQDTNLVHVEIVHTASFDLLLSWMEDEYIDLKEVNLIRTWWNDPQVPQVHKTYLQAMARKGDHHPDWYLFMSEVSQS